MLFFLALTMFTLDSGTEEKDGFDYKAVFDRVSDSLSIAEWKNKNQALDSLNNFNTVNSKSQTRKKADYTEGISISLQNNSPDLATTSKGDEGCTASDDAVLSNPLSIDVSILYQTYSGLKNGGKGLLQYEHERNCPSSQYINR